MIRSFSDVYREIKGLPAKKVAVAQAADDHVLQAVSEAYQDGYAVPILFGDESSIRKIAHQNQIDLSPFEIIQTKDNAEAARLAVKAVKNGDADIVMKGLLDSSTFLKAVLNHEYGLKIPGRIISAIAVLDLDKMDHMVFLTDPGINPAPDLETKVNIIKNAVDAVRCFGIDKPKVAAISASETLNESMQSSAEAALLTEMNQSGKLNNCIVAGPMSLDLAISKDAAILKGYQSPVAGDADIVLVPTLEVGNGIYKSLMLFAKMETGGIIAGTSSPVVFCSRTDSAESKKNTLALAIYMAK